MAGPAEVEQLLEQQRQHGFVTPALAIEQLEAAGADIGAATVALRMNYHNILAMLNVAAERHPRALEHIAVLETMAKAEKCVPCGQYAVVRQVQQNIRLQDTVKARELMARLDNATSPDKQVMQAIHYARVGVLDSSGSHSRAVEEGLIASRLALETNSPADQVRCLNALLLANIARKDLDRAGKLAREAFALAERIGFVYMQAYIRGNEGWIFSLKGDKPNQLRALNDVLAITRKHKGMADSELVALVNLAEYHFTAREFKKAIELSQEAVALADSASKPTAKGVVMGTLGMSMVELGEADKGLAVMEQGLAILQKAGSKGYIPSSYSALADAYERAGRHEQALGALRKYVALTEEKNARASEKAIAEAQEKFSGERKDHEIERLSLENGRRQAEVQARAWQQRLWATAALALGLGAILLIQMVTRARRRNRLLEDSNAVLTDQSVHDPLTGAYNRRHCVELMGQQQMMLVNKSRDRNYKASVGLMLLDVDHFKHVNDTYGHAAGDAVLVEVARRLQQLVRQHDVVVRWGGEEFVLVLPGTAPDGMVVLAERVLKIIGEASVKIGSTQIPITVSAGCVCFPLLPGQHWEDCLKVADLAMYLAKGSGRNRAVCVMDADPGVTSETLLGDLGSAAATGAVTLRTVAGPGALLERDLLVSI